MGIVMRARSPRDVDRLPSLRGRGALPVLLSRRRRHVHDSQSGAVFSGLKRFHRIFGERRSPLEISRRREESRVRVSDSSIVMMVASRREMYMYSKKKNPPFFIRGVRSRGTVSIIITRSETERTLGELAERAFREAARERTQPRRRRQPPSREGPRELDRARPRERRERGQRL